MMMDVAKITKIKPWKKGFSAFFNQNSRQTTLILDF